MNIIPTHSEVEKSSVALICNMLEMSKSYKWLKNYSSPQRGCYLAVLGDISSVKCLNKCGFKMDSEVVNSIQALDPVSVEFFLKTLMWPLKKPQRIIWVFWTSVDRHIHRSGSAGFLCKHPSRWRSELRTRLHPGGVSISRWRPAEI